MRELTFEIDRYECVGDSVGKHNYNALSLDTVVCNLSSEIFNKEDSILTIFNDISTSRDRYNSMAKVFSEDTALRYNINTTTINLLSSFWEIHEFTIPYEYNMYTPDTPNQSGLSYANPHLSDGKTINAYTTSTPLNVLLNTCYSYLSTNLDAKIFPIGTRANINLVLHNTTDASVLTNKVYKADKNTQTLVQVGSSVVGGGFTPSGGTISQAALSSINDYDPENVGITYNNVTRQFNVIRNYQGVQSWFKIIKVDFEKQNTNFTNICTFKFINNNYKWKPYDIIFSEPNLSRTLIDTALSTFSG
jgi:hypothetical protein